MSADDARRRRRSSLTAAAVAYLVWKIDLGQTIDVLVDADPWWFALSVAIMVGTVAADGAALEVAARGAAACTTAFRWLTRAYFVSYTAGQILPTSIGGDAVRDRRVVAAPSGPHWAT